MDENMLQQSCILFVDIYLYISGCMSSSKISTIDSFFFVLFQQWWNFNSCCHHSFGVLLVNFVVAVVIHFCCGHHNSYWSVLHISIHINSTSSHSQNTIHNNKIHNNNKTNKISSNINMMVMRHLNHTTY